MLASLDLAQTSSNDAGNDSRIPVFLLRDSGCPEVIPIRPNDHRLLRAETLAGIIAQCTNEEERHPFFTACQVYTTSARPIFRCLPDAPPRI
jgi:hypothetical protein